MLKDRPLISICVPTHNIPERNLFVRRLISSVERQTYKNCEVVFSDEGKMAENSNAAIRRAKGDIVKILYMDDYLFSENALENIATNFKGGWFVSGCVHDEDGTIGDPHFPSWNEDVRIGNNTIGSPSVLAFENVDPLVFDEKLSWLLDCDLYERLYRRYGIPTVIHSLDIAIGVGPHQTTHKMSNTDKYEEYMYLSQKYGDN